MILINTLVVGNQKNLALAVLGSNVENEKIDPPYRERENIYLYIFLLDKSKLNINIFPVNTRKVETYF